MNKYAPTFTIALVACWACLGPTTVGHAQTGNPQIDQYTEHVPDSGGGQPTGGNGNGNGNGGGGGDAGSGGGGEPDEPVLEQEQSSELDDLGQDGAGVADLTEDTSPDAGGAGGSGGGGDDSGSDQASSESGSGPSNAADFDSPATTSSGSDGNDGLGVLLPLIIGSLALGGLGLAVWRQRAAGTPA